MTSQSHQKPQVYITCLEYQIYINIEIIIKKRDNIYISIWDYKNLFLIVYETTNFMISKFMKKKSESLFIFMEFIIFLTDNTIWKYVFFILILENTI